MIVKLDGKRIRAIREGCWMTRDELARKAGIGASTLRNIEASATSVRLSTARKLARALDVPPKSLAEGAKESRTEQSTVA